MDQNNFPFDVYGDESPLKNREPICITFGNFDGVHIGHQYLFNTLKKIAKNKPTVVVTFSPHSSNFFTPNNLKPQITSENSKIDLLLKSGISTVIVQKFDEKFAQLSSDEFCEKWLNTYFNIHSIVLGYDFCYGKNRSGDFKHMQNFGKPLNWHVEQVKPFHQSPNPQEIVSSSQIRNEISLGHMNYVEQLLGRPYVLTGQVVQGDQRGRTIGFPTANIKLDCNYVLPKYGVYACYVSIGNNSNTLLPSVMNCGIRPSVAEGLKLQIEAHILNFNQDIYHQPVKFYPAMFLRGEIKFRNLEELKHQIEHDVKSSEKFFS